MEEFDKVIGELTSGKSTDPTGPIREVFKNGEGGGHCLKQSVYLMMNAIKRTYIFPLQWSQIFIHTVKKKNVHLNKLESYSGIFLVSILSLII